MAFSGVMARLNQLTAVDYRTLTTLAWDAADDYDVGNWHDPAVENTKLIVPAGVTRIRLYGGITTSSFVGGAFLFAWVIKNGVAAPAPVRLRLISSNSARLAFASPPIAVSPGDSLEMQMQVATDTSINILTSSFFAAEAVMEPPVFSGAKVRKTADQTGADYSGAGAIVAWNSEDYDVGGWHDNVTNNSRLTVPAGVSFIRASGFARVSLLSALFFSGLMLYKNGASTGIGHFANAGSSITSRALKCPPLPVVEGDYFEMLCQVDGDSSHTFETESWFAIQKVG